MHMYSKNNSIVVNIKSTKAWKFDNQNHGVGLKMVNKLVNKYNWSMGNEDKGNFYEVNIIIWQ